MSDTCNRVQTFLYLTYMTTNILWFCTPIDFCDRLWLTGRMVGWWTELSSWFKGGADNQIERPCHPWHMPALSWLKGAQKLKGGRTIWHQDQKPKWPNMAGLSTFHKSKKESKRDQNDQPKGFWPFRTLLDPSGSFWTISNKNWFFAPKHLRQTLFYPFGAKIEIAQLRHPVCLSIFTPTKVDVKKREETKFFLLR